jgi:L-rhamnose isomerase
MASAAYINSVSSAIKRLVDEHGLDERELNSFSPAEIDDRHPMQVGLVARQYGAALNRALAEHDLKCVEVYKKSGRTFLRITRLSPTTN